MKENRSDRKGKRHDDVLNERVWASFVFLDASAPTFAAAIWEQMVTTIIVIRHNVEDDGGIVILKKTRATFVLFVCLLILWII